MGLFLSISPSEATNVIIKMVLFVQSQQTHVLDLSQQKTVQDVKTFVNDREGLPAADMAVYYEGQPLEDACQLYNFKNEATLHVELRMVGVKSTDPWLVLVKCVVRHQKLR